MTVLLSAEYRARSSDLKIAHSNTESAAELSEFSYRVKTFCRYLGENLAAAEGEIRESSAVGTAYSSSELIKL